MSSSRPGRSLRHPARSVSDPGHRYITPPTTVRWPPPARRTTEPVGRSRPPDRHRPRSRDSSTEGVGDSSDPSPDSPVPPNNQTSGDEISVQLHSIPASRQETFTVQQQSSRTKDLPPPPLEMPIAQTFPDDAGYAPGFSARHQHSSQESRSNVVRQTSHHGTNRGRSTGQHEATHPLTPHRSHSSSGTHHVSRHHNTAHPTTRRRSRSRPPSANSHRYASSPLYPNNGAEDNLASSPDHVNSATRSEHRHHNVLSRTHTSSSLHHRPTPPTPVEPAPLHTPHKLHEPQHHTADPTRISGIFPVPGLHPNIDQDIQTPYVKMLLALDDIPQLFNLLGSFFTWILLAGFILFPGTFASWKDAPAGSTQSEILAIVNNVPLLVFAWLCTGVGGCGMIWLWWRWQNNYIWIVNRIFVPGLLNSFAGVISTLTNVYGSQGGVFSSSAKSTIIVTGSLTVICGILVLVYQFGLIRNLRLEHEREIGVEKAGKHGEGALGEQKRRSIEA